VPLPDRCDREPGEASDRLGGSLEETTRCREQPVDPGSPGDASLGRFSAYTRVAVAGRPAIANPLRRCRSQE
jgi:hypothetical protein